MNILDENFPDTQRQLLTSWRISIRQIGYDIGQDGMQDSQIIHLLHQTRRSTFFTLDVDFYNSRLCHRAYCLVYLSVAQFEAGGFVRRVLRHPHLDTQAKRMGKVIRASHAGLTIWQLHGTDYTQLKWVG